MAKENIFGLQGCDLPNNKGLCSACCIVMTVESMQKPEGEICTCLTEKGCPFHGTQEQSFECRRFHCQVVSTRVKLCLIAQCLSDGVITEDEAADARRLWIIS